MVRLMELAYPETVVIPAGETSVDVQLSFSDDGDAEGFAEEIIYI